LSLCSISKVVYSHSVIVSQHKQCNLAEMSITHFASVCTVQSYYWSLVGVGLFRKDKVFYFSGGHSVCPGLYKDDVLCVGDGAIRIFSFASLVIPREP